MADKFLSFREATARALFGDEGVTPRELRTAVAKGNAPPALSALIATIRSGAYKVTDEDINALRQEFGEEGLFEIILAATHGMASEQLAAAHRALDEA